MLCLTQQQEKQIKRTCFGNKNHAFAGVSARTFKGESKAEISHHDCALKRLVFSPGPFPPQDVNLIGHK